MSSRKEQKEQLRQERLQREQAAAGAAQRKKLVGYGAAAVLGLAAIVAVVIALTAGGDDGGAETPENVAGNSPTVSYAEDPPAIPEAAEFDLRAAARAADCRLEDPPNEGADHVEGAVEYQANPPTSGSHNPVPTEDGAYTQQPAPENAVHSLEHGRINIQFSPDLPQQQIDQLKALFDEDSYHMLLYPNADMPFQVAATAWDHSLLCEKFSPQVFDALRSFKDQYRDQGPEQVP